MAGSHFPIGVLGFFVAISSLAQAQQAIQPLLGAPLPGLTAAELDRFNRGKEMFERTLTLADGVGPIMNEVGYTSRCLGCHFGSVTGGGSAKNVVRFGVAASGSVPFDPLLALGGPVLQEFSINYPWCNEVVPPAANVISHRITPPVFGLGLVEAIADSDIQVREAFPPAGVSGRANVVTPVETPSGQMRVGRFGWKSQIATVLTFSGEAMLNEHGITNRLFPLDNATHGPAGTPCNDLVPDPEDVSDAQGFQMIDRVTDFVRLLAPPPQTPKSGMSGELLFDAVGCTRCHVSTPYVTMPTVLEVALQNKPLRPYSDFLVHDIGTGDGIPDGLATDLEIRTAPLWGIGRRAANGLLHDVSAWSNNGPDGVLHAAVLAHGGEAAATVATYMTLSALDQRSMQRFLMSLGRGEFDYDSNNLNDRVDELDWFFIRLDLTGPGTYFDADDPRANADFDQDGDIDLRDLAGFQRAFTGL